MEQATLLMEQMIGAPSRPPPTWEEYLQELTHRSHGSLHLACRFYDQDQSSQNILYHDQLVVPSVLYLHP